MTTRDWTIVAARLTADTAAGHPLRPVSHLRIKAALGVSAAVVVRWIVHGKRGFYLDGIRAGGKGWSTTTAACIRFLAAITANHEAQSAVDPLPQTPSLGVSRPGDLIRAMQREQQSGSVSRAESMA